VERVDGFDKERLLTARTTDKAPAFATVMAALDEGELLAAERARVRSIVRRPHARELLARATTSTAFSFLAQLTESSADCIQPFGFLSGIRAVDDEGLPRREHLKRVLTSSSARHLRDVGLAQVNRRAVEKQTRG